VIENDPEESAQDALQLRLEARWRDLEGWVVSWVGSPSERAAELD
jgi:hypothetical protein